MNREGKGAVKYMLSQRNDLHSRRFDLRRVDGRSSQSRERLVAAVPDCPHTSRMIWIKRYHDWAFGLEKSVGSDTLIHVNVGLGIWLLAALIARRPFRDPWLLLPVVIAEGGNEICDYIIHEGWSVADTLHDIFWTLLWPVLIFTVSFVASQRKWRD